MDGLRVKIYRAKQTVDFITPTCHSILIRNIGIGNAEFKDAQNIWQTLEPDEEFTYTAPVGKMIEQFDVKPTTGSTTILIQAVI